MNTHPPMWFIAVIGLLLLVTMPVHAWTAFTLETDHFLVHFPQRYEGYAREVATAAEWAHQQLVTPFGYSPTSKTHVVILDDGDLPNGFADPYFFNRIGVVPVEPVGPSYRSGLHLQGRDWLDLLMVHEYAHILHLDMHAGTAQDLRRILGRIPGAANPHTLQSYMLMEGIAIWYETQMTDVGRGTAGFYEMFAQALSDHHLFLQGDQALGRYDLQGWQPGPSYYLYGYLFVDYLMETYGEETFHQMLYQMAESPISLQRALMQTYGRGFQEIWTAMIDRRRWSSKAQAYQPMEPLKTRGQVQQTPRFSPDGEYLVYFASGGVLSSLRLYHWHTGEDKQVQLGYFGDNPSLAWLTSSEFVYTKLEPDASGHWRYNLYHYDLSTHRETRLTQGQRIYSVSALPDQTLLVAELVLAGTELAVQRGDSFHRLVGPQGYRYGAATVSQEGDVVLSISESTGYTNLYHVEIHDHQYHLVPITHDHYSQNNPVFSPDHRYLLFDSNYHEQFNVYALDQVTGRLHQVTHARYGAFSPAVSPCGSWIVVMDYTASGYQLARLPFAPDTWTAINVESQDLPARAADGREPYGGEARPYTPWTSLRPGFWLPILDSEPQLRTGLYTAGKDAFELHAYSVQAAYGWQSNTIDLDARYQRRFPVSYSPTVAVQVRQHTHGVPGSWNQQQEIALSGHVTQEGSLSRLQQGLGVTAKRPPFGRGVPWTLVGQASLSFQRTSGYNGLRHQQGGHLTVTHELNTADRYTSALVSWHELWTILGGGSLTAKTTAARSQDPTAWTAGGLEGTLAVRGYPMKRVQQAHTLTLQYSHPILHVERGWGDQPIFLQNLQLSAFFDAAVVGQERESWGSVGLELGARLSLSYGQTGLTPTIGLARTMDTGTTAWYVRLGVGSFYF